jgi:hypothetical protein
MDSRTKSAPPAWAAAYLRFDAWTQDEFRNLLCGLPPVQPHDAAARPANQINVQPHDEAARIQKKINDDYVRDELRRVEADRHIRDAIVAGHLRQYEPPTEGLLEKVTPHLTPDEVETIRRAIAHDRICAKAYRFSTATAIAWAVSRQSVFPDFPFTLDDLGRVPLAAANTPDNGLQASSRASEPRARTGAADAPARTAFPNRAEWLDRQLADRKWTLPDLKLHGGPDPRTTEKILSGEPVKDTVLMRLAHGLSEGGQVSRGDIPDD